jgi:hypothetical protein
MVVDVLRMVAAERDRARARLSLRSESILAALFLPGLVLAGAALPYR